MGQSLVLKKAEVLAHHRAQGVKMITLGCANSRQARVVAIATISGFPGTKPHRLLYASPLVSSST